MNQKIANTAHKTKKIRHNIRNTIKKHKTLCTIDKNKKSQNKKQISPKSKHQLKNINKKTKTKK